MVKKRTKAEKNAGDDFFFNLDEVEETDQSDDQAARPPRFAGEAGVEPADDAVEETESNDLETADDEAADEDDEDETDLTETDADLTRSDEKETATADWIDEEGQLPIDVFQDSSHIYIKAPLPGVDSDDIDISLDDDMLTIRAKRDWSKEVDEDNFFYKENYWGSVSRSIILPVAVAENKVDATLKNGILTVSLPKLKKDSSRNIKVKSQED